MEERSFHPLDYVSVLRRRKWWFVAPLVLCILGGALLAMLLPRKYKSAAEIGVAAPTLSPELLRGVSSLNAADRQRAVSQQLLSRNVLERVVRDEQLSPSRPIEDTAARLRLVVEKNIEVPLPIGRPTAATRESGIESFRLGYVDKSPERAQRIANRLATVFVEENSMTRTRQAENTSEVLGQQARASQERLAKLQTDLRTKKEAFMGRLPDQMEANIHMVNGLRQQLESISMEVRGGQDQLRMVEGQLDAMRQGIGTSGVTATSAAAIHASQARLNLLQQELTKARATGYTDLHPEIVRINQEIAEARKEIGSGREQTPNGRDTVLMADPFYRQKASDRDALKLRIAALQRESSQARAQIAAYQSRVDAAPMVEQELASLQQEYDLEKARYGELTNKHQGAVMAEDMARKQGGERFSVLYPASVPIRVSPDFLRLMLLATALGLALGVGAVVTTEFLDRSVHDARALQTEFEVPVLGEIPRIHGVV
jgi:polysaccharide chain length determinant protein (PEP-CTERM system associated)